MARGKGKKRVLLAGALLIGALFVLLLALPVWFPWILKPLARKQGATYASYERLGYSRFALRNLIYTNGIIDLQAQRAEAFVPSTWLWRALRQNQAAPFVRVENWELKISGSNEAKTSEPGSLVSIVQDAQPLAAKLQRWLPNAVLSNGVMEVAQQQIAIPELVWKQGRIETLIELPHQHQQARITAQVAGAPNSYHLEIASESLHLNSTAELNLNAGQLIVSLTNAWLGNRIDLEARFPSKGLLPETASLRATNLTAPGHLLKLEGYQELRGTVIADWSAGQFSGRIFAQAEPGPAQTNWPAAQVQLEVNGDTNTIRLTAANLSSPAVSLVLSRPIELHLTGPLLREAAQLSVAADLSAQPWIAARGRVSGTADLQPGRDKYPRAQFAVTGTNVACINLVAKEISLQGTFEFPLLELSRSGVAFDDGSHAEISGRFDLAGNVVVAAQVDATGALANRWLPKGYSYQNATIRASLTGPITNLEHEASIALTNLLAPDFKPVTIQAKWRGQNLNLTNLQVAVATDAAALEMNADTQIALNRHGTLEQGTIELKGLNVTGRGANQLALQSPATISWMRGRQVQVAGLRFAAPDGDAYFTGASDWPQQGDFRVAIHNLGSDLVAGFLANVPPPLKARSFETTGGWTNGPILFQVKFDAEAEGLMRASNSQTNSSPLAALEKSELQAQFFGREEGISISNFVASGSTGVVAVAKGFIPVSLDPRRQPMLQINSNAPIDLTLKTEPGSLLWAQLAAWTGIVLEQPEFDVETKGTLEQPLGQAHLRARKIEWRKAKTKLPAMEELKVDLVMDPEQARLDTAQVLVEHQPVILSGHMPLGPGFWEALIHKRGPNWDNAEARLRIDHAAIAAFADLFPTLLAPQGHFDLDAEMLPGGKFQGHLNITRARTRPLPSVGAIRDIGLNLTFAERELRLAQGNLNIGGATITLAGKADLRGTEWLQGIPPPFQFSLRGTNVPLAREPESIVRADLDLRMAKTNEKPALISGTARVHDSYYLSDLSDLVPGKAASPKKRPPYFSIDVDPLATWGLNVEVKGEKGFRVRSTLFNGQISLNLKLAGTLKEPIALGEAKIDTGTIRFPFANLDVQQGFVTLTSQNPYEPQLLVAAASKQFGYDVRMDMTGSAESPVIKFSSTPPLSSEQLVLMLTAGELPRGEFNLTPQQKAQTVALFLGKDLLAKLGFGDQSEERLSFTSGQEITEQGKPTYSLEYKLTDRWSLVGEYDRFNAYNAGLKWRVYSK